MDNTISSYNSYDRYLFLLIATLVCGKIGGGFQVSRMLAIVFFPFLMNLLGKETDSYLINIRNFCVFWAFYNILSLLWTSDFYNGLKECVYYVVHFIYFLEIIEFSKEAFQTKKSISAGWTVGLLISLIIAIWEIKTDNHLNVSKYAEAIGMNVDGTVLLHHFASVTFGNYNGYVVYICMSVPFLFYFFIDSKKYYHYGILIIMLMTCIYVLFTNASRGGIMAFAIFLCYYFVSSWRAGNFSFFTIISILAVLIGFVVYYWDSLSVFILARTSEGFNDKGRWEIWGRSLQVFGSSWGAGSGVGSIMASMRKLSPRSSVLICHNVFLELLVQYGVIIFYFCISFLWRIFKEVLKIEYSNEKITVMGCFLMMLPLFIIDSAMLLNPNLWAFIGSLFVFTEVDTMKLRQYIVMVE